MARRILRGFFSILSGNFLTLVLGAIIVPLIIRVLGSSLYGDYAFIMSILAITSIITNAGISRRSVSLSLQLAVL